MTDTDSHLVTLLLGSNMGDRISCLQAASQLIEKQIGTIKKSSSIFETKAWGIESQPDFLNQVLLCSSVLIPAAVLSYCLAIEKELGRARDKKWGSRIIDIDILYFDQEIIVSEDLKIPHPFLHERRFTLAPLSEILPDYIHPVFNCTNSTLLDRCMDPLEVQVFQI